MFSIVSSIVIQRVWQYSSKAGWWLCPIRNGRMPGGIKQTAIGTALIGGFKAHEKHSLNY
jgi:hypothetical protein